MEKGATLTLSLSCNNKKLPAMLLERNENGGVLHNGMSLFQDLKLKRRKVDSRCSSDGESVGTSESASSLSPDSQPQGGDASPKADKERCLTPEELVKPPYSSHPPFYFMMKNEDAPKSKTPTVTTTANVVVVKSEPDADSSSPSSSPGLEDRDLPSRKSPKSPSNLSVKSEGSGPEKMDTSSPSPRFSISNGMNHHNGHHQGSPPRAPSSSPRRSPPSLIITKSPHPSSSPPHLLNLNHFSTHLPPLPPHLTHPTIFHATQLHARLTQNREPSPKDSHPPPPLSVVTSTSLSFHQGGSNMYRINGVRPELISGGAVTPSPPSSGSPPNGTTNTTSNGHGHGHGHGHGLNPPHHHLPPSPYQQRKSPSGASSILSRSPNSSPSSCSGSVQHSPAGSTGSSSSLGGGTIIAGGSIGMGQNHGPGSLPTQNGTLNRTPTVIMGEAGGVRTMLWSQPGQPIPNPGSLEIGIGGGGASPPGSGGSTSSSSSLSSGSAGSGGGGYGHPAIQKGVLSMERLWESEAALNLSRSGASNTTNGHGPNANGGPLTSLTTGGDDDEYEQPMICMICEDRATGLHYGIITCEGCKGFFKRTVQNRRVYTCVADGTCEITKAQRNRCQYCRFKKCIEQGMVLQAVREDRMPGGRNSGAVYNLYKVPVKYRKHKKGNRANGKGDKSSNASTNSSSNPSPNPHMNGNSNNASNGNNSPNSGLTSMLPPHPGNILMAALTDGIPRRQLMPFDQAANMINALVQCDNFHDIAALHNWEDLLQARGELSEKLCEMGDSIVYRLVQWTKQLPFYAELPVEVHTRVLTHKWHELLVLTTSAWHAMHSPAPPPGVTVEEESMENLQVLQRCLQAMMGRSLTLEQLKQDVGQMVDRLTLLTRTFRRLGIRLEEYVTLKVIAMLQPTGTKGNEATQIQDRYVKVLRTFLEVTVPSQPNRLSELLRCLPDVQNAAALLLESKMFYVPFLLNSTLLQR